MAENTKDNGQLFDICVVYKLADGKNKTFTYIGIKDYSVYLPVILGVSMDGDSISVPHLSELSDDLKERLQQLHFKKILLSDFIFVVNPGGYIGEGTRAEIEYAECYSIPVKYLEEVE